MAKPKHILWLSSEMTPALQQKQAAITKIHYECRWVRTLDQLAAELSQQRVSIIIISEGQSQQQSEEFILGLATLTEARGARWLLSLSEHNPAAIELAACSNFRDFIPLDLPEAKWLFRVLFSSSHQATAYPFPSTFLTLDHPATLAFPCRIIWLNSQQLRIECHVRPPLGSTLTLSGAIFSKLGATSIKLKINKIDKTRLSFRFSAALEGSWQAPCAPQVFVHLMQGLAAFKAKPKFRLYLAIKTPDLRQTLIRKFSAQNFDINSALQVQNLENDPIFFSPDVIIMEDHLCTGPFKGHFGKMIEQVQASVPIIVLGEHKDTSELVSEFSSHNIHTMPLFNESSLADLIATLLPTAEHLIDMHANTFYTENNSVFSCALIQEQGRLSAVEVATALIACPYPVKDFSYCQISSPFLQKNLKKSPWIKITELRDPIFTSDPSMTCGLGGFFTDLRSEEKQLLVAGLLNFIENFLNGKLVANTAQSKTERDIAALERPLAEADGEATLTEADQGSLTQAHPEMRRLGPQYRRKPYQQPSDFRISKNAVYIALLLLAVIFVVGLLNYMAPRLSQHFDKSGGVYSDQLQQFHNSKRNKGR